MSVKGRNKPDLTVIQRHRRSFALRAQCSVHCRLCHQGKKLTSNVGKQSQQRALTVTRNLKRETRGHRNTALLETFARERPSRIVSLYMYVSMMQQSMSSLLPDSVNRLAAGVKSRINARPALVLYSSHCPRYCMMMSDCNVKDAGQER